MSEVYNLQLLSEQGKGVRKGIWHIKTFSSLNLFKLGNYSLKFHQKSLTLGLDSKFNKKFLHDVSQEKKNHLAV